MGRISVVPFGPQHAALLEPVNVKMRLEEERVVGAEVVVGYNHRGMERALCHDLRKSQFIVERVCGICSFHHSSCYCQGMESIASIDPPLRAKIIRVIMMELQRMTSHLLCLAHVSEASGYENLFMQFFRERDDVMQLVNRISGNRVHYSMNIIGGVKRDIDEHAAKDIVDTLASLRPRLEELREIVRRDRTFVKRTRGVGILRKEGARSYCTVGPVARASGLTYDVRQDGYAAYGVEGLSYRPIFREEGDAYARTMVRMDEVMQSMDLVEQCLGLLRNGPISSPLKGNPTGESHARVEAPRGELYYFIKANGKPELERVKIRTPSIVNLQSLGEIIIGSELADVPVMTASIDPCICCTDR